MNNLKPEFQFASFNFPKWVWNLHRGPWKKRLERRRNSCTGWGYYHAPRPLESGDNSRSFYLNDQGMPSLRWKWCDEVPGSGIRHRGWYCDDYYGERIHGVVFRLPRSRGFLAGWSMGVGRASNVDYYVFESEHDAAQYADSMAENAAEREREYREEYQANLAKELEEQDEEQS